MLGYLVLKEDITIQKILSMMLVISGLILVLQPWRGQYKSSNQNETDPPSQTNRSLLTDFTESSLYFNHSWLESGGVGNISIASNISENPSTTPADMLSGNNAFMLLFGYFLAISSGLGRAGTTTVQKRFSSHIAADVLTFYICCGGCFVSALLMLFFEQPKWPNNHYDTICLFVHTSTIGLSQLLGNWSKLLMPQILYYITTTNFIIFSIIGQYTLLSDINPGYRNAEEISGVALIIFGMSLPVLPLSKMSGSCDKDKAGYKEEACEDVALLKRDNK